MRKLLILILGIFLISFTSAYVGYSGYFDSNTRVDLDFVNSNMTFLKAITFDYVEGGGNYVNFTNVTCLDNSKEISEIYFNISNTERDINYYCNISTIVISPSTPGGSSPSISIILNSSLNQTNLIVPQNITTTKNILVKFLENDFLIYFVLFLIILIILILLIIYFMVKKKKKY